MSGSANAISGDPVFFRRRTGIWRLVQAARCVAFYLVSVIWTVVLGVFYIVLFAMPRRYMQNCGAFHSLGLLVILKWCAGLSLDVRGLENVPRGACIIAAKHQSALETIRMATVLDRPAYVLKRSLFKIPIFGWYLKACGQIGIDRSAGAKALRQIVADAQWVIKDERPIIIFPEGTRVPPGERRRFQVGVEALYERLGLPVVPVALNTGLFWPRESFIKWPGRPIMEFLPPMPPGLDRATFRARLYDEINTASERLPGVARLIQAGGAEAVDNSVEKTRAAPQHGADSASM